MSNQKQNLFVPTGPLALPEVMSELLGRDVTPDTTTRVTAHHLEHRVQTVETMSSAVAELLCESYGLDDPSRLLVPTVVSNCHGTAKGSCYSIQPEEVAAVSRALVCGEQHERIAVKVEGIGRGRDMAVTHTLMAGQESLSLRENDISVRVLHMGTIREIEIFNTLFPMGKSVEIERARRLRQQAATQ